MSAHKLSGWVGLAMGLMLGPGAPAAPATPADAAPPPAPARQTFAETTNVTAVEIPVQVVRDGEPLRGLTAADFEIYEGRKQHAITGFDVVDLGAPENQRLSAAIPTAGRRHFLLIFDLANSHPKTVVRAREAAAQALLASLLPSDVAAVATYGGNSGMKLVLGFTSDRRQILAAIQSLGFSDLSDHSQQNHMLASANAIGNYYFDQDHNPPTTTAPEPGATPQQVRRGQVGNLMRETMYAAEMAELPVLMAAVALESKLNQHMDQAEARNDVAAMAKSFSTLARMMDAVAGRKLVLFFSEGFDSSILEGDQKVYSQELLSDTSMKGGGWLTESDTRYGSASENNRLEKMLEVFRRSGCVIESIDIGGLRASADQDLGAGTRPSGETALFQMAHDTGGDLYHNFNDLGDALRQLARSTEVTYLLTFQPQGPLAAGSYHAIKVRLKNQPRGIRISFRPGYYAPRPYGQVAPLEKMLAASDQMMSSRSGGSIATAVLAAPFRTATATAYVPVIVEADGGTLLAGATGKTITAELYVNAVDGQGAIQDYFDQNLQLDAERAGPALRRGGLKFFGHLELPPGDYSLRVLLRNGETGAYGKRSVLVTVPAFGGTTPVLLPPLFPEAPGRWAVVRELPRGDQRDVAYPFVVSERAYVPAALPTLEPGQHTAVALVVYNLGEGEPSARARIQSEDGRDLGDCEIELAGRERGDGTRPDVYRAVLSAPPGLAPGDYRLLVTVTGAGGAQTATTRLHVAAASGDGPSGS